MPRRSERGYLLRPLGGAGIAFVPHPAATGLWLRCHWSILVVKCRACDAQKGEPCKGKDGWRGGDGHWQRRRDAQDKKPLFEASLAIVFDVARKLGARS